MKDTKISKLFSNEAEGEYLSQRDKGLWLLTAQNGARYKENKSSTNTFNLRREKKGMLSKFSGNDVTIVLTTTKHKC